jgi:uncharacterized membrane-anchored protein YjiN (DUF445 family)
MKRRATALLAAVTLLYIGAVSLRSRYPWLAYLAAASEAGIVGALADWFAVVALFRHPLDLKWIPHTNIISRNRGALAKQLGEFIQREFLAAELVAARIREFNPARQLSEWMFKPQNVAWIADYVARFMMYGLTAVDDVRVRKFVHELAAKSMRELDLGRFLGDALEALIHDDRRHVLLEGVLGAIDDVLTRDATRKFLVDELPRHFWILQMSERLSEKTADKAMKVAGGLLSEVRENRDHDLRRRFDEAAIACVERLRSDPDMRARLEQIKLEILEGESGRRYVESLWNELNAWVRSDLRKDESTIRAHIANAVRFLGEQLHEDNALQEWINEQILTEAPPLIERYRSEIGRFIEEQVNSWTNQRLVHELEQAIGPDLQYIRINGTIVGACAGLAIFTLTQLCLS